MGYTPGAKCTGGVNQSTEQNFFGPLYGTPYYLVNWRHAKVFLSFAKFADFTLGCQRLFKIPGSGGINIFENPLGMKKSHCKCSGVGKISKKFIGRTPGAPPCTLVGGSESRRHKHFGLGTIWKHINGFQRFQQVLCFLVCIWISCIEENILLSFWLQAERVFDKHLCGERKNQTEYSNSNQ